MHRTDKRRIQKEFRKGADRAIRRGIPPKAQPNEVGAVAIAIRDRLVGQRTGGGNAAEAAEAAFQINNRSLQTYPSLVPIECARDAASAAISMHPRPPPRYSLCPGFSGLISMPIASTA
jgi:hypothetical protein